MKKINLLKTLLFSFLILATAGCGQQSNDNKTQEGETDQNEAWEDFKAEMQEVGDAIGDLFQKEEDQFQESANEVLGDIERKIDKYKAELSGEEREELNKLEAKADDLEKKINEMDEKAEEEWAEAKADIEEGFRDIKNDIDKMLEDDEY